MILQLLKRMQKDVITKKVKKLSFFLREKNINAILSTKLDYNDT